MPKVVSKIKESILECYLDWFLLQRKIFQTVARSGFDSIGKYFVMEPSFKNKKKNFGMLLRQVGKSQGKKSQNVT